MQFKCKNSLIVKNISIQAIQFNQTIQFSLSMPLVLFNPLDRALSGATKPGQNGPGSNGNERCSVFPKAPALLEPHQQMFCVILGHSLGGVLPLCRGAVSVFYSPNTLDPLRVWFYCVLNLGIYIPSFNLYGLPSLPLLLQQYVLFIILDL